jgi:hypothetical protein
MTLDPRKGGDAEMEPRPSEKPLEEQTPEQLHTQIHSYKRTIIRSAFLALTALVAIFALCLAWFVNNQRVSVSGVEIGADSPGFELAAVGSAGNYDKKLTDVPIGSETTLGRVTYRQTSGTDMDIRWVMSADSNLNNTGVTDGIAPNTSGKLTFYVIPYQNGDLTVDFTLSVMPYREQTGGGLAALATDADDTDSSTSAASDEQLRDLLEGHVLFFQGVDATGLYTDWIQDDTFTVTFADAQAGTPYPVTIYWVWPNVVGQMLLENPPYGALFSDAVRKQLQKDMTQNANRYFYGVSDSDWLTTAITDQNTDELSPFYNQADEQLGQNVDFISVQLIAQLGATPEETQTNGTQETITP